MKTLLTLTLILLIGIITLFSCDEKKGNIVPTLDEDPVYFTMPTIVPKKGNINSGISWTKSQDTVYVIWRGKTTVIMTEDTIIYKN